MSKVRHYRITVAPIPSEAQAALIRANRDMAEAGDRRDSDGCDWADKRIAEAEAAIAAAGEEPLDERSAAPTWTEAMGRACFQRILEAGEKRTPGWDGWREMRATLDGSPRFCSLTNPGSVARWSLANLECIPHEVVPYLPGMIESARVVGRSVVNAEGFAKEGIDQ